MPPFSSCHNLNPASSTAPLQALVLCTSFSLPYTILPKGDSRSNGVGKELMKYMESYLKGLGCKYITIEVFSYNDSAKNFYKNRGYHSRMINMIKKIGD